MVGVGIMTFELNLNWLYEKKLNSTNIDQTNDHFSHEITERQKGGKLRHVTLKIHQQV